MLIQNKAILNDVLSSRKSSRSGFTLMEMIVAVSIVLVLAALLTPAMRRAIGEARRAGCASNLHQLGVATLCFISETSTLPQQTTGSRPTGTLTYLNAITPYLSGDNKMKSDSMTPKDIGHCPSHTESGQQNSYSYRANSYIVTDPASYSPVRLVNLPSPSGIVLLYEVHTVASTILAAPYSNGTGKTPHLPNWSRNVAPHQNGQWNFLFADGHVESLQSSSIPAWIWSNFYLPLNPR